MNIPTKLYGTFCIGMGLYGFTRGYRSFNSKDKERLTSDKITNAIFNALFYAAPIANIGPTIRLINRLEIEHKGLNMNDYKDNYREFVGDCEETI
jgi:hypothetical protein